MLFDGKMAVALFLEIHKRQSYEFEYKVTLYLHQKTKKAKEQKKILNSQQKTLSLGVPTLAMSGP